MARTKEAVVMEEKNEEMLTLSKSEYEAAIAAAVDAALAKRSEAVAAAPEDEETRKARELNEKMNELVPVELPYSREQQAPLFVGVNGRTYLIKRGEEVMVPRFVKEVINNMKKQDRLVLDLIREKEKNLASMP